MPKTIEQVKTEAAARVITAHLRQRDRCSCGSDWSPLHVAKNLAAEGLFR